MMKTAYGAGDAEMRKKYPIDAIFDVIALLDEPTTDGRTLRSDWKIDLPVPIMCQVRNHSVPIVVGVLLEVGVKGNVIHGAGWVTTGLHGVTTMRPGLDAKTRVDGWNEETMSLDEWEFRGLTLRPEEGAWPEVTTMRTSKPPTDEELHAEMMGWDLK